jgi:two-component system phosphate regulon sensor histidine kinase PhoR
MPGKKRTHHALALLTGCAVTAVVAWWSGHPLEVVLVALGASWSWHIFNVFRLQRWLDEPIKTAPGSYGIWADVISKIMTPVKPQNSRDEANEAIKSEFQSLADAFPDAFVLLDDKNNITWLNTAAQSFLGLNLPEDLGKSVTRFLTEPGFSDWLAVQNQDSASLELQSPLNEEIWLNVTAVAYLEHRTLLILRNFSELHKAENIRRDFVANISHELRTPLTVLLGYLEMLQPRQGDQDDNAVAINRMYHQAQQMLSLLNDLLELSRLQSDQTDTGQVDVDVPAILVLIKAQAEELSAGKHTLTFVIDSSAHLDGTTKDIESAFRNLVINALHFTPKDGSITVTWQDAGDEAEFIVSDTGIGIPKRDLPRLTERFYRVGSDRARETGGTGLGLSIVKHALNKHQARLEISSEVGTGSEFRCIFPAERVVRIR